MNKVIMKTILLQFEDIIDNIYLQKYIDLILANINTEKIKFKTQSHHFIPVSYYKAKYNIKVRKEAQKLADEDSNNFKVSLLYKDHVLAHYYLALCSRGKLRYQNENAIFHVLGNVNYIKDVNYLNECLFIKSLDKYQELYEDMAATRSKLYTGRHCKPNTEEHKKQISLKNKGNIYVRRKLSSGLYEVKKAKNIDEFNEYIANGWEKGNYPRHLCKSHVEGARTQGESISIRKKGKKCITDGIHTKYVDISELSYYYNDGWKAGRAKYKNAVRS